MKTTWFVLTFALSFALATSGLAAKPSKKSTSKASTSAPGAILYDEWYTVKAQGSTPYGYYHEKAEAKEGKIFFQSQLTKTEDGALVEENLGTIAKDDPSVAPLFYNLHTTAKGAELAVDGSITDNNLLQVRIRQGKDQFPMVKRNLPKNTILVSNFPVWLIRNWTNIIQAKNLPFLAVLEDAIAENFPVLTGRVSIETPDAYAQQHNAAKLKLELGPRKHIWWVNSKGVMLRFESPSEGLLVEKVTQKDAENFLKPK